MWISGSANMICQLYWERDKNLLDHNGFIHEGRKHIWSHMSERR